MDGVKAGYGGHNEDIEKFINLIKEENIGGMKCLLVEGNVDLNCMYPDIPEEGHIDRCLASHSLHYNRYNSFIFLMESGTSPNLYGETSLLGSAIKRSLSREVEYLLRNGADPNMKDGKGRTPLFISLESHSTEEMRLLLESGADPNILFGEIHILCYMAEMNYVESRFAKTKMLLERGAVPIDMLFLYEFSGEERGELEGLCYPRRKGAVKVTKEE